MRLLVTTAALALLAAGAAHAQPATPAAPEGPPPAPPKVFQEAGYSQPDITPGLCRNVNANTTQCVIPEMTAGAYLIQASGTSTDQATDSAQQIAIIVGDTNCGSATLRGTADHPTKVGVPLTIKYSCRVDVLTDKPLTVVVAYADLKATKDPKGPTLSVRKVPWAGVVNAIGFAPQQGQ